jgi:glutathione S-transferase
LKLYNSNLAPNPRRVRIFLAKKGLSIPRVEVDLGKLEHKGPQFSALNPFQTIPILELDDGTMIDESIAICRYIEELCPEPNLFGATALERAMVEMWQRRLEWRLFLPIAQAFRHSHPRMAEMEDPQIPDWGTANRPKALRAMALVDEACPTALSSRATASQSPTSPGLSRSISPSLHGSRSHRNSKT